jgi:hypothetical protein
MTGARPRCSERTGVALLRVTAGIPRKWSPAFASRRAGTRDLPRLNSRAWNHGRGAGGAAGLAGARPQPAEGSIGTRRRMVLGKTQAEAGRSDIRPRIGFVARNGVHDLAAT